MELYSAHAAQELAKLRQADLQRNAEMHRLAKAAREQRRHEAVTEEEAPRSSRLVRALTHALNPVK